MTNQEIALQVDAAINSLNEALIEAQNNGLDVFINVKRGSHIDLKFDINSNLEIEKIGFYTIIAV